MKIFFDVDGVLINSLHATRGWLHRWDKELEKDLGISPVALEEIFTTWFRDVQIGRLDFNTEMSRWLKNKGYNIEASKLIRYWNEKDMNLNTDLWPTIGLLAQNPDIHLYVATNQNHFRATHLWNSGFKDYFKDIFYSAKMGFLKEEPSYFEKIENELNFDPRMENVLFFDDHPKNIEIASARGWNAVLFDTANDCINHPLIKEALAA